MKEKKYYYIILKLDDQFLVDVKAHYFDHSVPVVVLIDKNDEQTDYIVNDYESMADLFVELAIKKYLLKKASLDKYYGRKNK